MKEFIEKLIGRLEESQERYDDVAFAEMNENGQTLDFECAHGKRDGVSEAISIVNQLAEEYNQEKPTKTNKNQKWIPTAERLPEKNAVVLTCDKDGWISVNVYMPYAGVKNDFECGYYVAWMPLPEPFTPKEGRE